MTFDMVPDSTRVVTAGVDTHRDVHVVAVVDPLGRRLAAEGFPATAGGYVELVEWVQTFGLIQVVGVEGTGSWGAGLSRYLRSVGVGVVEVSRPNRQQRRLAGKSDSVDALAAARSALAGTHQGTPKSGEGPVETIRTLLNARGSGVKARTATSNQIRAALVTSDPGLREQLAGSTMKRLVASLLDSGALPVVGRSELIGLVSLAERWSFLDLQVKKLSRELDIAVGETAPTLVQTHCVGTITAATLLVCAGGNPDRLGSEAAFAALCGVAPVQASSGQTIRYRLNRGGNRQANSALRTIALARLAHDERTRTYMERRTAQGKTKKETIRCLKRAIAREVYRHIISDLTALHQKRVAA